MRRDILKQIFREKLLVWDNKPSNSAEQGPKSQEQTKPPTQARSDLASAGASKATSDPEKSDQNGEKSEEENNFFKDVISKNFQKVRKTVTSKASEGIEAYKENKDAIEFASEVYKLGDDLSGVADQFGKFVSIIIEMIQKILNGFEGGTDEENDEKKNKNKGGRAEGKYISKTPGTMTEDERQKMLANADVRSAPITRPTSEFPRNFHPNYSLKIANSGCIGLHERNGAFDQQMAVNQLTHMAREAGGKIAIMSLENKKEIANAVNEANNKTGIQIIHAPFNHLDTGTTFTENNKGIVDWIANQINNGTFVLSHCMNGAHRGPGSLTMGLAKASRFKQSMGETMKLARTYANSYGKYGNELFIQMYEYFEGNGCHIEPHLKAKYEQLKAA